MIPDRARLVPKSFIYREAHFTYYNQHSGIPILFLHGFLENSTMWQALWSGLPRNWRKLALDLPGHGGSDNLAQVHRMEDMAEVVASFLDFKKIDGAVLCGHSMGGYVALAFAEKYPERVRGICLLNSGPWADSEAKKAQRDRAMQLVKRNYRSYVRQAIPLLFRPKNRRNLREAVRWAKEEALQTSAQGIEAALEGMKQRPDRSQLFYFAPYPIAVISGRHDSLFPLEQWRDLIRESGRSHYQVEDGHMSHLEDFPGTLDALRQIFATWRG